MFPPSILPNNVHLPTTPIDERVRMSWLMSERRRSVARSGGKSVAIRTSRDQNLSRPSKSEGTLKTDSGTCCGLEAGFFVAQYDISGDIGRGARRRSTKV